MLGIRHLRVERVIAAAVAALLVFMSGEFLIRDLRLASVTRAAEGVKQGLSLDTEALRQLSGHAGLRYAAADCRGISAMAGLQMAALDSAPAGADPPLPENLLERTRESLAFELACSPLDGAAWLDYGRTLMDLEGPSSASLSALERSSLAAPTEAPVLVARLLYLQWLYAAGFRHTGHLFADDLGIAVRHLEIRGLAWLYSQASASVQPIYRDMLDAVPETRRLAVEREFARIEQSTRP